MATIELPRFMIEATKNLTDKVAAERQAARIAAIVSILDRYCVPIDFCELQKQTLISEFHEEDTHAKWRRLNDETEETNDNHSR